MTDKNSDLLSQATKVVQTYFKFQGFKDIQTEIVTPILEGKDVLALLPTGEGKSLTYQAPAMVLPGITVVISPLIALQEDQVTSLKAKGIPAEMLNSSLGIKERKRVETAILEDKVKILYVAPETLFTEAFETVIKHKKVSLLAIDEAHCFPSNIKVVTNKGSLSFKELHNLYSLNLHKDILIQSYNGSKLEFKPLVKVHQNPKTPLITFDLGDKGVIVATRTHVYITPKGEKQAQDIRLGEMLYIEQDSKLTEARVLCITYGASDRTDTFFYDLEVQDNHNYFVQTKVRRNNIKFKPTNVLVHNCTSVFSDFRPEYAKLHQIRNLMAFKNCTTLAVTATADQRIIKDIEKSVALNLKYKKVQMSFDRPSINYHVIPKVSSTYKKKMIEIINLHGKNSCGIIYCMTKASTETIANSLKALGYKAEAYHATIKNTKGILNPKGKVMSHVDYKKHVTKEFMAGNINIIVATIAFGMGIDKPNVRWVIHNDTPHNLENFSQEIGRASRDGLPSSTYLFYDLNSYYKAEFMINQSTRDPTRRSIKINKLKQMHQFVSSKKCRRHNLLKYFGEASPEYCGKCDNCGASLFNSGE